MSADSPEKNNSKEDSKEEISEIFKARDYHEVTEKLIHLTYSEDGFERDSAVTAIGMLGKNIPKDIIRKVIKRLLEISDPYIGHHVPEVIGELSELVTEDLREETIKFLFSLSKNEKTYMYVRVPSIGSGEVEMRTEIIDDTEYMRISAVSALLKFRDKISESLSKKIVEEIIYSSDLQMEKDRIELIKSMKHSIPDKIKNELAEKIISKAKDRNPQNKISGVKIIGEILSIFPEGITNDLANSVLENIRDKNPSIKSNSMDAFEKICGILDEKTRSKFLEELINESSNLDWTIRLHAVKTLGEVKDYIPLNMRDQIIKIMKNLIKDKEWLVKVQAMNSLSQILKL